MRCDHAVAVGEPRERGADAPEHALRVGVAEHAAVAEARRRVEVLDRVGEAARRAHDGDRAVAQRVHLREAARLVTRRHDRQVGAGEDLVRERLVVAFDERHARAMSVGEPRAARRRSAASPLPSTAKLARRALQQRRQRPPSARSMPFCSTRRLTTPISGASTSGASSSRSTSGCLMRRFGARSVAS